MSKQNKITYLVQSFVGDRGQSRHTIRSDSLPIALTDARQLFDRGHQNISVLVCMELKVEFDPNGGAVTLSDKAIGDHRRVQQMAKS